MTTAKPKEDAPALKQMRESRTGVKESMAWRRLVMVRPLCPIDDNETRRRVVNGEVVEVPNPNYTGEPNCQRQYAGAVGWWDECGKQGHDPYFTTKRVTLEEEQTEIQEDGSELITGVTRKRMKIRSLNTTSVAAHTRVNSGQGPAIAHQAKGYRTLAEMGYAPVCEYRNCEMRAAKATRYGNFCGERHARLVGADVEGIFLEASPQKRGVKEKQLKEIDVSPLSGGAILKQEPPALDTDEGLVQ